MPGKYSAADIDQAPQQQGGKFSATDVGSPAPQASPSWLDTVTDYAKSAGHFLQNIAPHPAAPPVLPAQNAEEWAKLTPEQKQDFTKQVSDWQAKNMVGSMNLAAGFMGGKEGLQMVGKAAGA